ncbi:MAG TPA: beta-L-arabinofuranosidase domain-containing protein [Prolixibacteraceae bacterium]|nr:beta-L-arabinofuranosidase domain-containing protein [Prolixibacteraceae bacterium]
MKKIHLIVIFAIWLTPLFAQQKKVEYKVANKCEPLTYGSQKIYGFLGDRMDLNMEKGLAKLPYYSYTRAYIPGVEAFWPSGEYLGKFAQALMYSYLYTNDQFYIEQTQNIIDTWVGKQEPDGYIATNPDGFLQGKRWNFWAVWEHKYTLLGLLDYYAISGEKRVLESARKIGNVVINEYGTEDNKRDLMGEGHSGLVRGSILEPMTYLYQYTGETKYLDFCNDILKAFENENGPKIISELTERSGHVSKIGDGKGYEMLSCIIGIFRMYQLTGNQIYLETAEKAWKDIVEDNLYITGTATQGELFLGNKYLPADETDKFNGNHPWGLKTISVGEGCVTAHWIFLNRLLFQQSGDLKYIDEIEKSLYNHLLGSQSAKTGRQSYFTALIGHKQFTTFNTYGGSPPCCLSSVSRCISTIPETIWTRLTDNGFAILMYNSGEFSENITTKDGNQVLVNLKADADIMGSGTVKMNMNLKTPASFRMALRVPSWCLNFKAQLGNGETLTGKPGEYLYIDRKWSGSEDITISMNVVDKVIEGSPSYKGFYAFKHGPYILALDQLLNPKIDIDQVTLSNATEMKLKPAGKSLPKSWMGDQAYSIETKDSRSLILTPFLDAGQDGSKYRVWISGDKVIK